MGSAMRGRGPAPGGDKELTDTSRESRRRAQGGTPADEPAAGSTQVKVVIPDDHSMVSLLGSGDELLHEPVLRRVEQQVEAPQEAVGPPADSA